MPDYKFTTTRDNNEFETGLFNSDGKTEIIAPTPVVDKGKGEMERANVSAQTDAAATATATTNTATVPIHPPQDNKALEEKVSSLESKMNAKLTDFNSKIESIKSELSAEYQQKVDGLTKNIGELRQQLQELQQTDKKPDFDGFNKRLVELEANKDQIEELLVKANESIHKEDTNSLAIKELTKTLNDNYSRLDTEVQKLWEEIAKLKGRIPLKIFDCESKSIDSKSEESKQTPITIFDCENKKDPQLIKIFDCKSDAVVAADKGDIDSRVGSSSVVSSSVVDRIVGNGSSSANSSKNVVDSPKTINAFTCDSSDPKTIHAFTCDSNVEKPTTPSQAINAFTCVNDNKETSDHELYSIIFYKNEFHYVSASKVSMELDAEGKKTDKKKQYWRITNSIQDIKSKYIITVADKESEKDHLPKLFGIMNDYKYKPVALFYTNKGIKKISSIDYGKIYGNGNNACYMVSVLQTLYHSNAFQDYLLNGGNTIESGMETLIAKYLGDGGINYETVKEKWDKKELQDKKSHILALIKHFQENFMLTANEQGNISDSENNNSFDKSSYDNHLKYLVNILKVEDEKKNYKRFEGKQLYGGRHDIFALIDMIKKYCNDLINYKAIDELNDIKQNDSKPIQVFDTSTYIYSNKTHIQAQNIPRNLPKDEQTKDGNITAFACAEPKITAFDCEKKGEIPTVQSSQISSLLFVQQSAQPSGQTSAQPSGQTSAQPSAQAATTSDIKHETAEEKPVIKAFECATTTSDIKKPAEDKPVIKAFECAKDKPVIKAFECAKEKPVIKAFECAKDKPVIKAFECAKDEASLEDIQVEDKSNEEKEHLIEQIVNKVSGVNENSVFIRIRNLINSFKEDNVVGEGKDGRTKLYIRLKNHKNRDINLFKTSIEALYTQDNGEKFRLQNHIDNNTNNTINVKDNANKTDNLMYFLDEVKKAKQVSNKPKENDNEGIRKNIETQLTHFTPEELGKLNKYLEKDKNKLELIENATYYGLDSSFENNIDHDNLLTWFRQKNKLFDDIQKLVLTMFACEPTLEEEIKKLHNVIKALYTTDNDEAKRIAAEAAAKKLKELREEHTDAYDKLMAELKLNANNKNKKLQEKLENKRKALENNADELETIEQDLIECEIENTSDKSKLKKLAKIITTKHLNAKQNLDNTRDVEQKKSKYALTLRLQELKIKANAKLNGKDSSPLNTPVGSRISTADENYLSGKELKEQIDAIRHNLDISIQEANNDEKKIEHAKTEAENEYKKIIDELKSELNQITFKYQQAQSEAMTNSQNFSNSEEAASLNSDKKSIQEDLTFVNQILKEHVEKNKKLDEMKENYEKAKEIFELDKRINRRRPLTSSDITRRNRQKQIFKEQQTRIGKGEKPTKEDEIRGKEHKNAMQSASELYKTLGHAETFQKFENSLDEELQNRKEREKKELLKKLKEKKLLKKKRSQSSPGNGPLINNFMTNNSESKSPRRIGSYIDPLNQQESPLDYS